MTLPLLGAGKGSPAGGPPAGPVTLGQDTFTDTAGTLLTAHTPESGGPWVRHTGAAVDMAISDANRVRVNAANTTSVHLLSGAVPSAADYSVFATLRYFTNVGSSYYIVARFDTASLVGYAAGRNVSSNRWEILRLSPAGTTLVNSVVSLTAGDYNMEFRLAGANLTLLVDTVSVLAHTDVSPITAVGLGGLRVNGSNSNSAGMHFDNFSVVQ